MNGKNVIFDDKKINKSSFNKNKKLIRIDNSTTLRIFLLISGGSVFYSTATLLSHLKSGPDFLLRTKHEFLCLVAGQTKFYTSH